MAGFLSLWGKKMNISVSNGAGVTLSNSDFEQRFIELVLGVCGAGKTYAYSQYINTTPSARFIVAAKTDALCEQIHKGLPGSVIINTDNLNMLTKHNQQYVTSEVTNAIKSYRHRVVIITHKALELLSMRLHYDDGLRLALLDCQVIIDEAPEARKQIQVQIQNELTSVYPWYQYTTIADGLLYATRKDKLREVLKGGDTKSAGLIIALINDERVRVIEKDSYVTLFRCLARSDLYQLFNTCKTYLVGANIINAPIVKRGLKKGLITGVKQSETIVIDPDRNRHRNSDKVKISSLLDVRASKRNIKAHCEEIAAKVIQQMNGKVFLFTCNNDEPGADGFKFMTFFRSKLEAVGGHYIKPMAEGLNTYQNIDAAAWLCSIRYSPEVKAEYDDAEEAEESEEWSTLNGCYQFLARTAIRSHDLVADPITFLVLDDDQKDYCVSNYFEGACSIPGFEPIHVEQVSQQERGKRKVNKTLTTLQKTYDMLTVTGLKVTQKELASASAVSEKTVKRYWSQLDR